MKIAAIIGIGLGIVVGNSFILQAGASTGEAITITTVTLLILALFITIKWAWDRRQSCSED